MPTYKATVEQERYYPSLGISVKPDDIVELPEAVDVDGLELVSDKKTSKNADASANKE